MAIRPALDLHFDWLIIRQNSDAKQLSESNKTLENVFDKTRERLCFRKCFAILRKI